MLDAFVTLLEVGQKRYRELLEDRVRCFEYLQQQLASVAARYGERLFAHARQRDQLRGVTLQTRRRTASRAVSYLSAEHSQRYT